MNKRSLNELVEQARHRFERETRLEAEQIEFVEEGRVVAVLALRSDGSFQMVDFNPGFNEVRRSAAMFAGQRR
jgi:hypothetical protein